MEMHLFIILTIRTGGIVMKNLTQPMGLNQLYRYIVNACPAMDVGDIRPYKTLMRYIQNRGYVVFAGGPGAVLLEKKHQLNSGGPERPLRIDELCKTAGRWARAAERAARSSYQRQCAEEDQEEIALLLEQCHLPTIGRSMPLYATKAVNPRWSEPRNGWGDGVSANHPGYSMQPEMANFVGAVSAMFNEDALDLDA